MSLKLYTPKGVLAEYMMGDVTELHNEKPKKIHEPETLRPEKIPGIKIFLPKKNTRLSTSIMIYSIKQTLRPKKKM